MAKNKFKYNIILIILSFMFISILSIYGASKLVYNGNELIVKQILWYIIGFILIFIINKININKIIDNAYLFYIIGNILLFLLLFLGKEVNGSKCWFQIPGFGSLQPSEFMKICLILINAKILDKESKIKNRTLLMDIKLFIKIMAITLLPSILTFLEPDTGMVIIYFLISLFMLFMFGIKRSIIIVLAIVFVIILCLFFYNFFYNQDKFIDIFGTSFFYRIDRIIDWKNKSGMQLTNALASIKAAGLTGFGLANTPIYFPEAHTDFIFSVFSNNFGLIGTVILIAFIFVFDCILINNSIEENNNLYKFIILGFIIMIIYQQIQNIGMNIGLLPITGITLPFISYGGSSLLSYLICIGIILNHKKKLLNE